MTAGPSTSTTSKVGGVPHEIAASASESPAAARMGRINPSASHAEYGLAGGGVDQSRLTTSGRVRLSRSNAPASRPDRSRRRARPSEEAKAPRSCRPAGYRRRADFAGVRGSTQVRDRTKPNPRGDDHPGSPPHLPPRVHLGGNPEIGTWSRRGDSNSRPAVYETAALPLSYVGWGRRARGGPARVGHYPSCVKTRRRRPRAALPG